MPPEDPVEELAGPAFRPELLAALLLVRAHCFRRLVGQLPGATSEKIRS
jgi:hypothetical protein